MRRNFRINSTVEIVSNGQVLDLHNDFDFTGFNLDVSRSLLELKWQKHGGTQSASLTFRRIQRLVLRGIDDEMPRVEDARLSFFGYLHREDRELLGGFLTEEEATDSHDFIVEFEGGMSIKIFADEAVFEAT